MRILLLWAVSLLAAGYAPAPALAAPLGEHFSPADVDAYIESAMRTLGDGESTIIDKDYAVRLLEALDSSSMASGYKSSACSVAVAALSSGNLERIHHGISLGSGVGGCSTAKTWRASEQVADAMESSHGLRSIYHATLAAPLLGVDVKKGGLLDRVLDLVQSDGSVRSYPGGPAESGNAFMAAELLAALVPSATGDAQAIALRTVESMGEKVLGSEPALLVQLNRASGEQLSVKASKLKTMARDLLETSRTSRPKSMLGVYEALKAIEAYPKAPVPIKLVPSSPSVEELSSGGVGLLVTSLLGSPVKVKSAILSKLLRADGSDALAAGPDGLLLGSPNSEGFRALPAVEVAAGVYTAEFSIELERGGENKALPAKLPVAVVTSAVLSRALVAVSERKDLAAADATSYALAPGESLPAGAQASALEGDHVHVVLALAGGAAAAPHQVFVRFTHALTGLDTFFVAAPVAAGGGKENEFSVSISLGEESATFLQRSGPYEVAVIVGGPLVTPPVLERLGTIDLDFPATKARDWPIYARALLHETDVSLGPLPEKHHTFREPEVRPAAGVSLLFTALALAPLAGLVYGLRRGGANLQRLPRGATGRAWCVAHQACMVAIVLLFVTYWLALTMAYTLQVLAVLSLVTTFTGRKALQSLAAEVEGGCGVAHETDSHTKVE